MAAKNNKTPEKLASEAKARDDAKAALAAKKEEHAKELDKPLENSAPQETAGQDTQAAGSESVEGTEQGADTLEEMIRAQGEKLGELTERVAQIEKAWTDFTVQFHPEFAKVKKAALSGGKVRDPDTLAGSIDDLGEIG